MWILKITPSNRAENSASNRLNPKYVQLNEPQSHFTSTVFEKFQLKASMLENHFLCQIIIYCIFEKLHLSECRLIVHFFDGPSL